MKILITGANGMVARAAIAHCTSLGDEVIALMRADLDIADGEAVKARVADANPDAVLNCAAFTDVDGSESNEAKAYATNADGPENLAAASREFGAKFLTISTDYVFGGEKDGFYVEDDLPKPLSVYGRSKYEGEQRAVAANPDSIIVRSGWIYGPGGTNFLSVMPGLLGEGKSLTVVSDSLGTPTYAFDLVSRMREIIDLDGGGIFHITNAGEGTTYYGFGQKICEIKGYDPSLLTPITDAELKRPAQRPANSRLASSREGLEPLPHWSDSLKAYLR
jgi:dTDP-4-dehydrorhamnose reductase